MLLCRDKDRIEVEYALQNISSPIGVSEFNVRELLPENLKSKLLFDTINVPIVFIKTNALIS